MINEISPRNLARLTGILYLTVIVGGVIAQAVIADNLINFKDAGATAANIMANKGLYRAAYSVYLIEMTAQVLTAVCFYFLLRPVSRTGALAMMVINLTASIIKTMARAGFLAALGVLNNASAFGGFSADQVSSLSLLMLRLNNDGATIALALFGPSTFLLGWLVLRSTFLPKWMGIVSLIGGALWSTFYYPPLGRQLFMVSALFALAGVVATVAWLVIKGVDEHRWLAQAQVSRSSIWS